MLRKETVTADTLELLTNLMRDDNLSDFFLVGGTALSLQIGHRVSVDLDLFSQKSFEENNMLEYLESNNNFKLDYLAQNTIKGELANVKVDLITHAYPLVKELQIIEQIRLASLYDIAAMKLNAIAGNGTRLKDFIDIAYLSVYLSLKEMIDSYEFKYDSRNPLLIIKSLAYHNDINFEEPVRIIAGNYSWKGVKKRLTDMTKFPATIFENIF